MTAPWQNAKANAPNSSPPTGKSQRRVKEGFTPDTPLGMAIALYTVQGEKSSALVVCVLAAVGRLVWRRSL